MANNCFNSIGQKGISVLDDSRKLLKTKELSSENYNLLQKSIAELKGVNHKLHGNTIRGLTQSINFLGNKLLDAISKGGVYASFEDILEKKGTKIRVENFLKLIDSGDSKMMDEELESKKMRSSHLTYIDIASAIQRSFKTHVHLLHDSLHDPKLRKSDGFDLDQLKKNLEDLHFRQIKLLSRFLRLCVLISENPKLTKMNSQSVAAAVAPSIVSLSSGFAKAVAGYQATEAGSAVQISALVKVACFERKLREKLILSLVENYDTLFPAPVPTKLPPMLPGPRMFQSSADMKLHKADRNLRLKPVRGDFQEATSDLNLDSSGSDSCLSDDDEDVIPGSELPIRLEGFLSKSSVSSSTYFKKIQKRYFRLSLDRKRKIAFLSYYKDNKVKIAKRHCILNSLSVVAWETQDSSKVLKVTFFADTKVSDRPPKQQELLLHPLSKDSDGEKVIKQWFAEITSTLALLRPRCGKSLLKTVLYAGSTAMALDKKALPSKVQVGYKPKAAQKDNISHAHGLLFGKQLVSKKKRRIVTADGFDLDMAYITEKIIAMGFPSSSFEGWFVRNNLKDVRDYFDSRHKDNYMFYNLCIEKGRSYAASEFHGRVTCYPHFDHNPPPLYYFLPFCRDVSEQLDNEKKPKGVVAVHCKAGKGRTGVFICAYFVYQFRFKANDAMSFYGRMRTFDGKGVTLPSQKRYINYFAELCEPPFGWTDAMEAALGDFKGVRPVGSVPLREDLAPRYMTRIKFRNIPEWMLEAPDSLCIQIISDFWGEKPRKYDIKGGRIAQDMDMKAADINVDLTNGGKLSGIRLEQEIKVTFLQGSWSGKKKKQFYFWLHSAFVGSSERLYKTEIDGLHKDKRHIKVPQRFVCEMQFSPISLAKKDTPAVTAAADTKDFEHKPTTSYDKRIYKIDEFEMRNFIKGLENAVKMYESKVVSKKEMKVMLDTFDPARLSRFTKLNNATSAAASAPTTKTDSAASAPATKTDLSGAPVTVARAPPVPARPSST